jgi:hypothetical protein
MFDFKIFKSCIAKEESLRKMKKDEKKKRASSHLVATNNE